MSEMRKKVTKLTLVDSLKKMRSQGATYGIIIPQVRREPAAKKEPVPKPETKTNPESQKYWHKGDGKQVTISRPCPEAE